MSLRSMMNRAIRKEMFGGHGYFSEMGTTKTEKEARAKAPRVPKLKVVKTEAQKEQDKIKNKETLEQCKKIRGTGNYCPLIMERCLKDGKKASEGGKPWCSAAKRRGE